MADKNTKIIFMGTPEFSATCLKALCDNGYNVILCVSQPDKPVGRKHIITPPPAKVMAEELGIPMFQPDSMKTDEAYEVLKSYEPDLVVTAAYGKILPERVLNIPALGCINVHASLLPKRRGSAPVQRAILDGDEVTGVTIMKMDVGMDTGDMLSKVQVPIDENIHTDELMNKLAESGSALLIDMIDDYIDGKVIPVPQDDSIATACPPIRSEEGEFTWDMDAKVIHNKVRALSTWPGAYVITNGKKFKVYDSAVCTPEEFAEIDNDDLTPGMILKAHKKDLIVKCSGSALKVKVLQMEGGKRLNASDCSHNFKIGQVIGC